MGNISFNPMLTTQPQNSFLQSTQGLVQGVFLDDPSSRMWLSSGQISSSVSQPIWGGMAITEGIAAPSSNQLGNVISIATGNSNTTGFTVFNRNNSAIITPGNNVPQVLAGMTAMFFRFGSNARIGVLCDSTLAGELDADNINQAVSWDFTNQKLIAFNSGVGALPVKVLGVTDGTSKTVSYNSGTGALNWTTGYVALIQI